MAMKTLALTLGVDVCKDFLDISDGTRVERIANSDRAIRHYLQSLEVPARLAVEPTQRYHQRLVQAALAAGHTIYLVDPYRLSHYRDAVGERTKSDNRDAGLLQRYLLAEAGHLRPYRLPPRAAVALKDLLRARARVTAHKVSLDQALDGIGDLSRTRTAVTAHLTAAIRLIDKKLACCLEKTGYAADARRCQRVPGIGPLSGAALVATYYRGQFNSADAFIAYMGLDLRVRESGRYRGQRKLSKRGDPELRRLLFNAARAGARTQHWRAYYQRLTARGLSRTAATVALSRKLARVAFSLLKNQTDFRQQAIA